MRPGEKAILPLWFRTGLVVALVTTLYYSYTHRLEDDAGYQQLVAGEHGELLALQKLQFVDLDQGVISVVNADDGLEITRLDIGEGGFMRSVMRGLVRERKAQGLGPEVPFELAVWEDGLVSLIDPATSRRVELSAFGKDNVEAFTRLISATRTPQKASLTSSS